MPRLTEVHPQLFTAGIERGEIPDDWRADGIHPIDLRSLWEGLDEEDLLHARDGELFRIANHLAKHVRAGKRIVLADEHNRTRAPLLAALTLVSLQEIPWRSRDIVRNAVGPDALSGPIMQRFFSRLKRHDVLNPPPPPKKIFTEVITDSKTGEPKEVKV